MKNFAKIAVAVAAIAVASVAPAQRMQMGGGMGMGSPAMTLFTIGREVGLRDDVARELKLTTEQKDKLMAAAAKQREEMMASFTGGGERPDRETITKMITEMQKKSEQTVKEILTEEQSKRLKELFIQRSKNTALMNPMVQEELKLTDTQKTKIADLQKKQNDANRAIFERAQNGEIERSEIGALMQKNSQILGDELVKVLTAEQATQFKAMGGVPFKFDEEGGGR